MLSFLTAWKNLEGGEGAIPDLFPNWCASFKS